MKRHLISAVIVGLVSSPAFAVENEQPAPAPAAAVAAPAAVDPTPAPAPAAKPVKSKTHDKMHEAGKPEAKDKDKDKAKHAEKPALSKTAYVRLLAAEIKRHTPKSSDSHTGSIHVAFTIGASGRVVSHKVQNSSNPALEPVVGQILASVHTPPPPGGSFSAVQEFNFH